VSDESPHARQGGVLVDAVFLIGLCLVGLFALRTTFDSLNFLVVGGLGLVLGVITVAVVVLADWYWLATVGIGAVVYFLFGGAVALQRDAIAGLVPTTATLADLAKLPITGWRSLLSTWPPVSGDSEFVVLVWLLGLVAGLAGFSVARRNKSPQLALLTPGVLFCGAILIGTSQPADVVVRGLVFSVLAVAWAVVRTNRYHYLAGSGRARAGRVVLGSVLAISALAAGAVIGPAMPGAPRVVLRDHVQPPIDVSAYPSPLPGLSKFSSASLMEYFDTTLLTAQGAPTGTRLRFAVLDQYDGLGWTATGASGDGFRAASSALPGVGVGEASKITVTVSTDYASIPELRNWVPSLGPSTSATFEGANARALASGLGYDPAKSQALVAYGLNGGDVIQLTTYQMPWLAAGKQPALAGVVVVPDEVSDFMAEPLRQLVGDDATPWNKLSSVGDALAQGYWSDGTKPDEGQYMLGDGQGRMEFFFAAQRFVGSDEQYATAYALAANRFGFPARVVFGATIGSGGAVRGQDVSAWVEIDTTDGWVAVPPQMYIPDRNRTPDTIPPNRNSDNHAIDVPPPNPVEPPSTLGDTITQATAGRGPHTDNPAIVSIWPFVVKVAAGATSGVLVLMLILFSALKVVRSHWRRRHGDPVIQIARGWRDMLDRVRDMGIKVVPVAQTYREQAAALELAPVTAMVVPTERAMFGPDDPNPQIVADYWDAIDTAKMQLLAGRGWLRRLGVHINPRSLRPLPKRLR